MVCFDFLCYSLILNISGTVWGLFLLEGMRPSAEQLGPEASPTCISHTANKVKQQYSPFHQVSKINLRMSQISMEQLYFEEKM